jgi:hypothetical protein
LAPWRYNGIYKGEKITCKSNKEFFMKTENEVKEAIEEHNGFKDSVTYDYMKDGCDCFGEMICLFRDGKCIVRVPVETPHLWQIVYTVFEGHANSD